ncbi:MAG TPA: hypothetical protein VFT31_07545 [Kribbella sp.]|nr:hypothetical protein [Kribbella sp.]
MEQVAGKMIVPVVDDGLGNSSYLVDLSDGRALAVDPSRDLRALRAEAERRDLIVVLEGGAEDWAIATGKTLA